MMLGQPHGVVTRLVHDFDPLERAGVDVFERDAPISPAKELEYTDLH
jgi:hypothetical protein